MRKWVVNGCAYYEEDSDINVGNIEEDIKILNSIIKVNKDFLYDVENQNINQKEIMALEHLLQDYARQKQINEEHQKINGELREKVKELEKYEQMYLDEVDITTDIALLYNGLLNKIKDKIKELENKMEYEQNERALIYLHKQRKILTELFGESEETNEKI